DRVRAETQVGPVGLDGPEGQEEPRPRGDGRRELVLREVGEPDGRARAHEAPSAGPAPARPAASATNVRLVGSRRITAVPGARRCRPTAWTRRLTPPPGPTGYSI